jgi:hypothetical protein
MVFLDNYEDLAAIQMGTAGTPATERRYGWSLLALTTAFLSQAVPRKSMGLVLAPVRELRCVVCEANTHPGRFGPARKLADVE